MEGPSSAGTAVVHLLLSDGQVQTMPIEEYLRGVVPAEMLPDWPLEALKAQAIASRSYATNAHTNPRHPDQGADLCTTQHCQTYLPDRAGLYAAAEQAVLETAGIVLYYQGQVVNAFYSANCGGHTLDNEVGFYNSETGFSPPAVPYLRGVDCPNPGPKNGHGVGMCQWGAHDLAESGRTCQEILAHYYTGVVLSTAGASVGLQTAVIRGIVRDEAGSPQPNVQVALQGVLAANGQPASSLFTTDAAGAFSFSGLAAGDYTISLVGTTAKRGGLLIEEPEELALEFILTGLVAGEWQEEVQQSSGQPWLIGSLPLAGIVVKVEDPTGESITTVSGSWPEQEPGGFRVWLRHPGKQKIGFLGRLLEVETNGQTTTVAFREKKAEPRSGVIMGRVLDSNGLPQPGRRLLLTGPLNDEQTTDQDGFYYFENLPSGEFTLRLEGTDLEHRGLQSDGQQTIPADFALPPASSWNMALKRTVGLRMLIGVLPEAGVEVAVVSPEGHQVKQISGSKAEYGPGAFEVPIWSRGTFLVRFLDQSFPIEFTDETVTATFSRTAAPSSGAEVAQARLVGGWMATAQAQSLLASLSATEDYEGLFSLEIRAGDASGWTMALERKSGLPLMVGRLPEKGIQVIVEDSYGNRATVVSGSKSEYGPGGFEVPAWIPNGNYTLRFLDQSFPVEVRGDLVQLTFTQETEEQARLLSSWKAEGEAQTCLERLEGQEQTRGIFVLEHRSA